MVWEKHSLPGVWKTTRSFKLAPMKPTADATSVFINSLWVETVWKCLKSFTLHHVDYYPALWGLLWTISARLSNNATENIMYCMIYFFTEDTVIFHSSTDVNNSFRVVVLWYVGTLTHRICHYDINTFPAITSKHVCCKKSPTGCWCTFQQSHVQNVFIYSSIVVVIIIIEPLHTSLWDSCWE